MEVGIIPACAILPVLARLLLCIDLKHYGLGWTV